MSRAPVKMSLDEIAQTFRIPRKALWLLQKNSLLSFPPTEAEINNLSFLSHVWGKREFLKLQLASRSKKERKELLLTAELTKPESYVLNRYLNQGSHRIYMRQILDELRSYYGISISSDTKRLIRRMRRKARYLRAKNKSETGERQK